jgi:hypothetical protein
MAEKFDNKMLMDPKSWAQYRQFVDSKRPISNPYFNDPEYLNLYRQYILSLENFVNAVSEAVGIWQKSNLPGPRRGIDFYKIESLRRFYETDAYKYFTYRQGFKSQLPPETRARAARGYAKDAGAAQWFGNEERVTEKWVTVRKEVEKICDEAWIRYKEAPEPKTMEIKKEVTEALTLAQKTGIDSPAINEMTMELGQW